MCAYVFVRLPGCLQAVRAIAWPLPWRWVVPLTIAALPATCLVPVTPPEALLTGDRSPCLSSKEGGGGGLCIDDRVFLMQIMVHQIREVYEEQQISCFMFFLCSCY